MARLTPTNDLRQMTVDGLKELSLDNIRKAFNNLKGMPAGSMDIAAAQEHLAAAAELIRDYQFYEDSPRPTVAMAS